MTRTRAGVALILVLAAALGSWLVLRARTTSSAAPLGPTTTTDRSSTAPVGPVVLTAAALKARAATLDQDVYWLGPEPGQSYQLERDATGDVFVRYRPAGTTVGTYPLDDAYATTEALARQDGWAEEHVEAWLVKYRSSSPATEVYLAVEGFPYQIEVYDPAPGRARSLVESGAVVPMR